MAAEIKIPSSYRYYKLEDLKNICGITNADSLDMLDPVIFINPSDLLSATLRRNMQLPMLNEKAKSEFIVAPILAEVWALNNNLSHYRDLLLT